MARNACVRLLTGLAGVLCFGLWTPGFSQPVDFTVKGELRSEEPRHYSEYVVQLVDPLHRNSFSRIDVRNDGSFEVRNVPPGDYMMIVSTLAGQSVLEQTVSVNPYSGPLTVRIPSTSGKTQPGAHTISMKQLLHPPSKRAFHSFVEAQKFSSSGDYTRAVAALEKAVQDSPDYAEAHINLGAQYVRTGRPQAAIAELNRAMEIAGPSAIALCDLSSAQIRLGLRDQAIASARASLKMDNSFLPGHLMLGSILVVDPATRAEGMQHLEKVRETFASARDILEKLERLQRGN
jgi:tetratricopeptide (TPR) repeat protein